MYAGAGHKPKSDSWYLYDISSNILKYAELIKARVGQVDMFGLLILLKGHRHSYIYIFKNLHKMNLFLVEHSTIMNAVF